MAGMMVWNGRLPGASVRMGGIEGRSRSRGSAARCRCRRADAGAEGEKRLWINETTLPSASAAHEVHRVAADSGRRAAQRALADERARAPLRVVFRAARPPGRRRARDRRSSALRSANASLTASMRRCQSSALVAAPRDRSTRGCSAPAAPPGPDRSAGARTRSQPRYVGLDRLHPAGCASRGPRLRSSRLVARAAAIARRCSPR